MRSAVIVSTARTPIGNAYRGAFNDTQAQTLAAHAIRAAVKRAGDRSRRDRRRGSSGAALPQGDQAQHRAGTAALRAGLPVTVAGMTIDRQCSSGLMAIATAAKQIIVDRMDVVVGRRRGVRSRWCRQPEVRLGAGPRARGHAQATSTCRCCETAEIVAERYGISRERAGRLFAAVAAAHRRGPGRRPVRRRDRRRCTTTMKVDGQGDAARSATRDHA